MANDDILKNAKTAFVEKRYQDVINLLIELPDNNQALSMLGAAYAEIGDYTKAIEQFKKATPSAQNYFNIAAAYKMQGNLKQACANARLALSINPAYERAKNLLVEIEQTQPPAISQPVNNPVYSRTVTQAPQSSINTAQQNPGSYQPNPTQLGSPMAFKPQPNQFDKVQEKNWVKLILGGLMVALGSMTLWSVWASIISTIIGGTAGSIIGIIVGLGLVILFDKWLADSAGAFETTHWVILIVLTGLIPALLIIKGFDISMSGYYGG